MRVSHCDFRCRDLILVVWDRVAFGDGGNCVLYVTFQRCAKTEKKVSATRCFSDDKCREYHQISKIKNYQQFIWMSMIVDVRTSKDSIDRFFAALVIISGMPAKCRANGGLNVHSLNSFVHSPLNS